MRIWPIVLLLLLASSGAMAQNATEIVIPMKDGRAEGTSSYSLADGTVVLTDWHEGQKHGAYREVKRTGVVLQEGTYEHGRRTGTWTRRDETGNTIATGHYLLGLRQGTHRRFEVTASGNQLVESLPYVLGIRHGHARIKEAESGIVLEGNFIWNQRHGRFASTDPKQATEQTFVCGEPETSIFLVENLRWLKQCKVPASIQLPSLPRADDKNRRRLLAELTATLCSSRDELRIPVFIGDKPLSCPTPLARADRMETFSTLVHSFLAADSVVDSFEYEFRNADFVTAGFEQSVIRKNGTARVQGRGHVDMYKNGRTAWTFGSKPHCKLMSSRRYRNTATRQPSNDEPELLSRYGGVLDWITVFAFSDGKVLELFEANLVHSKTSDVAILLVPRTHHDLLESITLDVGNSRYRGVIVNRSTVRLRNGDRISTGFIGLRSAIRPYVDDDGVPALAGGSAPSVHCGR